MIAGEEDPGTPPEWVERIAGKLPDAGLETLEGTGHFPHVVRPDDTVELVRKFIER